MSPIALIKTADGHWNLAVKVFALLITVGSVIFASGQLVGTVNQHTGEIGSLKKEVKDVDAKVNGLERGQVRHEVLDSVMVNELREMRSDVKQLLRRR